VSLVPAREPVPARDAVRFARFVAWLDRRRTLLLAMTVVTIAAALYLDLTYPQYPIMGFYLVPITLASLTLSVRVTVAVSLACLGLTFYVMALQDRFDGLNIMVIVFSAASAGGLIALALLVQRVARLYETERVTRRGLESLATHLQTLQEVAVLDADLPPSELLHRVIRQARQLLASDGCCIYRRYRDEGVLTPAACVGMQAVGSVAEGTEDPVAVALECRRPVSDPGDRRRGGFLAVPLLVRQEPYGVLALSYREPRQFGDVDVRLAASFGGQVALAIENARLRDELEEDAVAAERSRLARDLHDSVTQSLFAASLKAEAVRRRWRPESEDVRRNVEDVELLTRGALAEMRSLLLELRPEALGESSLATLLEQLANATEGRSVIDVGLSVTGARTLPPEVTVAFYRIAQEALRNVERHSGGHTAWVMLDLSDEGARLVIGDDGRGFDVGAVAAERLGLRIMRERAEAAGIRLALETGDGEGTVITADWPEAAAGR